MNEQRRVRWHVIFSGRVQHVGFRYTAYYMARELGLTGWVDNLPDGRVEMEVQGPPSRLRKLLFQLKTKPVIRIERSDITELPLRRLERKFSVRGYSD